MSYGQSPQAAGSGRESQRTYQVRRLLALGILGVVLLVIYSLAGWLFGDSDGAVAPAPVGADTIFGDAGPITVPPTTLAPTTLLPTTLLPETVSPTTSTTELPVKERVVPSIADPAELLILGDSDAGSFGPFLKSLLDATLIVATKLDYKTSSGLARPDFFNWPAEMEFAVQAANPDIVVVTFGGNDAQGLRNLDKTWAVAHSPGEGADDTSWREEYGRRVGAAMDYLGKGNRTLIWVGVPNASDPVFTARLRVQDEVVRAEAAKRPSVLFVDTWARFSGVNGGWAEYRVDPRDGEGKDVRADDGFHMNVNGAEILALDIFQAVAADLRARGAPI